MSSPGLHRSNADKRKAVIAALKHPKGVEMSDEKLAEHVGVSRQMVIRYRHEMQKSGTCNIVTSREGADGRTINTENHPKRRGAPRHSRRVSR